MSSYARDDSSTTSALRACITKVHLTTCLHTTFLKSHTDPSNQYEDLDTPQVNCTASVFPSAEYLATVEDVFTSDTLITLGPLFLPPITWSMSAIAHLETARREERVDLALLDELGELGKRVPSDELAVALTDGDHLLEESALSSVRDGRTDSADTSTSTQPYKQRPRESSLNFALRVLFRQGLFTFKHPGRFAVIRKEALLYALLGPEHFLGIARSNRLSPLAYRTVQLPPGAPFWKKIVHRFYRNAYNRQAASFLAFGIYEWVSKILYKAKKGNFHGAEVDLFKKLELRLRGVAAAKGQSIINSWAGFLAMDSCIGGK